MIARVAIGVLAGLAVAACDGEAEVREALGEALMSPDYAFASASEPGLPDVGLAADDPRFADCRSISHAEAIDAPGVYRVSCLLDRESDDAEIASGDRSISFILDSNGATIGRPVQFGFEIIN